MKMRGYELVGPERTNNWGDRWRTVRIGARTFQVGVIRGKRVRIAYSAKRGWEWWASVRDEEGSEVYSGSCRANAGVRGILVAAGLLEKQADAV